MDKGCAIAMFFFQPGSTKEEFWHTHHHRHFCLGHLVSLARPSPSLLRVRSMNPIDSTWRKISETSALALTHQGTSSRCMPA